MVDYVGKDSDNTQDGTAFADMMQGLGGNDTLNGLGGDDVLDGGTGHDTLSGGDDNDRLTGGEGDDLLYGGNGDDTIDGGFGNDVIGGLGGNDQLYGGNGDDVADGGDGNDTVEGGGGNVDIVRGGAGNDTVNSAAALATVEGGDGNDYVYVGIAQNNRTTASGGAAADTFGLGYRDYWSNPYVWGSFGAAHTITDFSRADGDKLNVGFAANGAVGGYPILFRGEIDASLYADGATLPGAGLGNDFIQIWWSRIGTGTSAKTVLIFDLNRDNLLSAADLVIEFAPRTLTSVSIDDFVAGTFGTTVGTSRVNMFEGTDATDRYYGVGGNDRINGNDGNDFLNGGAGNDTIYAGLGDDVVDGGADKEKIYGEAGQDTLRGGAGDDTIEGGDDDDMLYGGADNDTISGGFGIDNLWGEDGNDKLSAAQMATFSMAGMASTSCLVRMGMITFGAGTTATRSSAVPATISSTANIVTMCSKAARGTITSMVATGMTSPLMHRQREAWRSRWSPIPR